MLPCDLFSQNFLGTLFYLLEPMCCRFNRIENDASSHFHFVSNILNLMLLRWLGSVYVSHVLQNRKNVSKK